MNDKRQSTGTNTEMKQIMELSDKDFRASIIKLFQRAVTHSFEANEKNRKSQENNQRYKRTK